MKIVVHRLVLCSFENANSEQKEFFKYFLDRQMFIENSLFNSRQMEQFMKHLFYNCPGSIKYVPKIFGGFIHHTFECVDNPSCFVAFDQSVIHDVNMSILV